MNTPALVLDTNVVLDWLWFHDASMQTVAAALADGRCRWLMSTAMRAELLHVLHHRLPPRAGSEPAAVIEACARWAVGAEREVLAPTQTLPCRDSDDQMFVDLALVAGAASLLTRDRALLALARRARARGLEITTPARWQPPR